MNLLEVRVGVKTFRVHLKCEKCGVGEMVISSMGVRTSIPPQYHHICNECGAEQWIRGKSYPRLEYMEVE